MAEDGDQTDKSQKTEDPTPRKLEEARKRGQVAQSREVNNWFVMFTATMLVMIAGPGVMSDLSAVLRKFLEIPHMVATDGVGLKIMLQDLFTEVAKILVFPLLLLVFAGVMAGFVQIGPLFTTEPLKPDPSRISLIKGMGRLFSGKSVAEFVKGILKLVIVSVAGIIVLLPYFDGVEHFVGQDFPAALFDMRAMFLRMMMAVLGVLFVIAVLDYAYQRYSFLQQMRMSKQEIRDEYKQTEGDPHVKARLRQLREQKSRQRMMQAVPEADVVITNPTHYAVALKYDPQKMEAPTMVAKGVDAVALRIREVAKEHKVTIVENPPLARALHASMEIDQIIPAEHWKAVAEVISYVFKIKGRRI